MTGQNETSPFQSNLNLSRTVEPHPYKPNEDYCFGTQAMSLPSLLSEGLVMTVWNQELSNSFQPCKCVALKKGVVFLLILDRTRYSKPMLNRFVVNIYF